METERQTRNWLLVFTCRERDTGKGTEGCQEEDEVVKTDDVISKKKGLTRKSGTVVLNDTRRESNPTSCLGGACGTRTKLP